jgi:DNA-binding NtrC family response regulator
MNIILIIDDVKHDLRVLSQLVKTIKWTQCFNCEEGIAKLSVNATDIAAVFVSDSLSFLSGPQVQKIIKSQYYDLPVIITYSKKALSDYVRGNETQHCLASCLDFKLLQRRLFKI